MFFNEKMFGFDKFLLHCGLLFKPISLDSLLSLFSSLNLWMFLIFIVSFESVDWIRGQTVTNSDWLFVSLQSLQAKLSFSSKEIVALSCAWCKSSYHNKEACFNPQRIGEECTLGKCLFFFGYGKREISNLCHSSFFRCAFTNHCSTIVDR